MGDVRVMVVDDEARLASLVRRGLEEEGYAVDVVGDGPEAVWMASEQDYDAIVLDHPLPVTRWGWMKTAVRR